MKQQYFIIDFDSTFVQTESLEDLAEIALDKNPQQRAIVNEIRVLTDQAMDGSMPFTKSLEKRIALLSADKSHIRKTATALKRKISPSFLRNKKFLKTFGKNIFIVSGGFKEIVTPIVSPFGIPEKNIFANTFVFDKKGSVVGIDKANPLSQTRGKVTVVKSLKLDGDVFVVGDGFTDLEVKQQLDTGKFIAFTENAKRTHVTKHADKVVKSLDEIVDTIQPVKELKNVYFTVGPSQLYPTVSIHIRRALEKDVYSLSHRSDEFTAISNHTHQTLRELLSIPKTHHIFFTSCALEAMERTVANTVHKKSFHFVNGSFSREFYQIATDLKKEAVLYKVPNGEGFNFDSVIIPSDTELICLVQNETSVGVSIPMSMIYDLKKRNPNMLLAMDVVSAVPYLNIDFSMIDIAFFSVQKGFGMPSGLGVLIVNDKALEKSEQLVKKGISIGSYHSFPKYREFEAKFQTRETPNVANIYLLGKVAKDMLDQGVDNIRRNTDRRAKILYDFFDAHPLYKPHAKTPFRSPTTIVIEAKGQSEKLANTLLEEGIIVSQGFGKRKDYHMRIANFPAHSFSDFKQLVKALEKI